MGYRFKIQHANYIGHLVKGNVITFLESFLVDEENFEVFENFERDFFSNYYVDSRIDWSKFYMYIDRFRRNINRFGRNVEMSIYDFIRENYEFKELASLTKKISRILSRSKVKIILLPGFEHNKLNSYMISRDGMSEFFKIHPNESCLILQLKDIPKREDIKILNVFDGFEEALFRTNEWPGVFIWNNDEFIFIPVAEEKDIIDILNIIKYEKNSLGKLKDFHHIINTAKEKKYSYILHLSDLHLGNRKVYGTKKRLLNILENTVFKEDENIYSIITGDLVDSPNIENRNMFKNFIKKISECSYHEPFYVLGNHDVNHSGISFFPAPSRGVIADLNGKKIEIIDELKLIILKFNSTLGGNIAQGEITNQQLSEMGNELDDLLEKNDRYKEYQKIALLHHHPKEIDEPDWMERKFVQKILGGIFPKTMELIDSKLFLEWISNRKIKFIFHGHKHIPYIHKDMYNGVFIIAAGSSTGEIIHKEKGKTYLTFNLIAFDTENNKIVSNTTYYEEVIGSGIKHMDTNFF